MSALLLLLVLGVDAPLGPYARPGVPVVVVTKGPMVLDAEGWTFAVEGEGVIHLPRVPCTVRDDQGEVVLRFEPAPEGLVGVVGGPFEGVPIERLPATWRALDLFDAVALPDAQAWTPALTTWVRGGGTVLLGSGRAPDDRGLGRVVREASEVRPPRVPRIGNTLPRVYDLLPPPGGEAPALGSARWVVWGACLAFAIQIILAAVGLLERRLLWGGLALVALAGAVVGLVRPRSDYSPVARGDVVVSWTDGEWARVRTFRAYLPVGPGAECPQAGAATPILYGANTASWWREPGPTGALPDGFIRVFMREEVVREAGSAAGRWPLERLEMKPPEAQRDRIPVLVRVAVALQD